MLTQDILNETEKYIHGGYTYNEIMSRISNSTTIKQLINYEEYFTNHSNKYTQKQINFAAEFIEDKFKEMENKCIVQVIEDLTED